MELLTAVSEWVSFTSHSIRTRSFRRRVFPGNHLQWSWQLITQKTTETTQKYKLALYKYKKAVLSQGEPRDAAVNFDYILQ